MKAKLLCCVSLLMLLCSCANANQQESSNKDKLYLINESEHGMFYSPSKDDKNRKVVDELALHFEANYERITEMFQFAPPQKTIVHIYTDREQFYQIIGRQTEGTYDASDNIIKVYTPQNIENPQVYKEYTFQLVHEFVHAIIQRINPVVGRVKWLDEGTAYFASLQLKDEMEKRTIQDIPTLEQLESPTYFDDFGGTAYFNSGLIIKFITEKYGAESLNKIIRNPEDFENILNTSIEDSYSEWIASLQ